MTTKKTVKKSTKKPSAKQIAARKKFAAAAKARAKKAAPKTRKTTTGKRVRTEAAKKARRAKNTVEGYYPNPSGFAIFITKLVDGKIRGKKYYFTGSSWMTEIENAKVFSTSKAAENSAKKDGQKALDQLPADYAVGLTRTKK